MPQTRQGKKTDIQGVLSLQSRNLFHNLTEAERESGFVTTPFTISQLEAIINQNGLFVAVNKENVVVAYVFAGSWEYFKQWEIFNFMTARFPQLSFNGNSISVANSFQYGPICIDRNYRGKGLLNLIFEEMRLELVKQYPISITFINTINVISEKVHTRKLGWIIVDEFKFNKNQYISLAFDMNRSVLSEEN